MVSALSDNDRQEFDSILEAVRNRTTADISFYIVPYSEGYGGYLLFDTFLLAATATIATSYMTLLTGTWLIALFAGLALFLLLTPFCKTVLLKAVPKSVRHRHAAKLAGQVFLRVLHATPAGKPVVLLFVAKAEQYVHILHSRAVVKDTGDQVWKDIVSDFTQSIGRESFRDAGRTMIDKTGEVLSRYYPVG